MSQWIPRILEQSLISSGILYPLLNKNTVYFNYNLFQEKRKDIFDFSKEDRKRVIIKDLRGTTLYNFPSIAQSALYLGISKNMI